MICAKLSVAEIANHACYTNGYTQSPQRLQTGTPSAQLQLSVSAAPQLVDVQLSSSLPVTDVSVQLFHGWNLGNIGLKSFKSVDLRYNRRALCTAAAVF